MLGEHHLERTVPSDDIHHATMLVIAIDVIDDAWLRHWADYEVDGVGHRISPVVYMSG
jgi:hypothetical protein